MLTHQPFMSEFSRLRVLGFGRLEASALLLSGPACLVLQVLWRVCIAVPFFLIGALTLGLWLFLPGDQLVAVASMLLGDADSLTQIGRIAFLFSAVLEGMRYVWKMNASLLNPVEKEQRGSSDNLKAGQQ